MGRTSVMHSEGRSIRRALSAAGAWLLFFLLQIPLTQAATIQAIMGGGSVLGTECVNGLVVEDLYSSKASFEGFGANVPLYVKTIGKTLLKRTSSSSWASDDRVRFWNLEGNAYSDVDHFRDANTGNDSSASAGFLI